MNLIVEIFDIALKVLTKLLWRNFFETKKLAASPDPLRATLTSPYSRSHNVKLLEEVMANE